MSNERNTINEIAPRVGERYVVTIHDVAFGGEGVARIGDFVVFVPFVIEGEEVELELTEVKRQFARARLLEVRKPSPARVEPKCRYFGQCGGCQYQHIDYEMQLAIKRKQVADLLARVGRLEGAEILPVIPCRQPYGYRNRLMVRSQWNKFERRLVVGFLRWDSRLVVDVEECAIAENALNIELKKVRLSPPPRGGLKVVLRSLPPDWVVPQDSFFQTNRFMLKPLVDAVGACIRESGVDQLADVYCGVGFFAIELAGLVTRFIGIECDLRAIKAAHQNARVRAVTNGNFIAGLAEEKLPEVLSQLDPERTVVILDPPRVGCDPRVLNQVKTTKPAQVLYVSCNPATLARDLNALCAEGIYRLVRVQPLDMFPQTQHVECVADLRLSGQHEGARGSAFSPGLFPRGVPD
ncbi:MAG: class I SAM-dependent RNA methyltransferase [Verrucomicrobiae bacterium]|nr:class I SAM-dependent RNA methyltransferase [Verrucomicrobiae bacterium]